MWFGQVFGSRRNGLHDTEFWREVQLPVRQGSVYNDRKKMVGRTDALLISDPIPRNRKNSLSFSNLRTAAP
jgi:hypothetical protein